MVFLFRRAVSAVRHSAGILSAQRRCFTVTAEQASRPTPLTSYQFTPVEPDFNETEPYKLLQLEETATFEEIQQRFFELGRKYHTDLQRGDSAKFKKLWNAYESLVKERTEREPEWDGGYHSYLQSWREPETHIFRQIFELQWLQKTANRQAELARRENEHLMDSALEIQYHTAADWFALLSPVLAKEEKDSWQYWLSFWRQTWAQRKSNKQNRDAAWVTNNYRRVDSGLGIDPVRIQTKIQVREDKEISSWKLWEEFFFEHAVKGVRKHVHTVRSGRARGNFYLSNNSPYVQEFEH